MSLQDLGNAIEKDRQSIHSLEKGQFNPSYIYLLKVCKGLEIELDELVKDV
ncbi:MAG: helix-turn-helix domain-containing protein [Taibaiella sp.]|nr:helix-turn-helix domain-containing protein [Taibaiella sp.]